MKQCFKCEQTKPISEFYAHPYMADGRLGKCKECTKSDVRANYAAKRERYSTYDRERYKIKERRLAVQAYVKAARARHPDKAKARRAVAYAIRVGKLVRSACVMCGAVDRVQAHHHDYSKPLEIEWLCFRCHRTHAHGQTVTAV